MNASDTLIPIKINYDSRCWFRIYRDHGRFMEYYILGKFDKDLIRDTAFLWVPMDSTREYKEFSCNPCRSEISFSNGLPSIVRTMDIGGRLENVGDLNGDGIDELGYDNGWFIGCWGTLEIYLLRDTLWEQAGMASFYACDDSLPFKKRIVKMGNGKIKLLGDDVVYPQKDEYIFDLNADTLPHLVSEKVWSDEEF